MNSIIRGAVIGILIEILTRVGEIAELRRQGSGQGPDIATPDQRQADRERVLAGERTIDRSRRHPGPRVEEHVFGHRRTDRFGNFLDEREQDLLTRRFDRHRARPGHRPGDEGLEEQQREQPAGGEREQVDTDAYVTGIDQAEERLPAAEQHPQETAQPDECDQQVGERDRQRQRSGRPACRTA